MELTVMQEIVSLGEEAHLNTSFKHFVYFIQEFELIDKKELAPLQVTLINIKIEQILLTFKTNLFQDLIDRLTNAVS